MCPDFCGDEQVNHLPTPFKNPAYRPSLQCLRNSVHKQRVTFLRANRGSFGPPKSRPPLEVGYPSITLKNRLCSSLFILKIWVDCSSSSLSLWNIFEISMKFFESFELSGLQNLLRSSLIVLKFRVVEKSSSSMVFWKRLELTGLQRLVVELLIVDQQTPMMGLGSVHRTIHRRMVRNFKPAVA